MRQSSFNLLRRNFRVINGIYKLSFLPRLTNFPMVFHSIGQRITNHQVANCALRTLDIKLVSEMS